MLHVTFFEDMGIYERNNCAREKFIRGWGRNDMLQCRGIIVWFPHHNNKKYIKRTSDSVATHLEGDVVDSAEGPEVPLVQVGVTLVLQHRGQVLLGRPQHLLHLTIATHGQHILSRSWWCAPGACWSWTVRWSWWGPRPQASPSRPRSPGSGSPCPRSSNPDQHNTWLFLVSSSKL